MSTDRILARGKTLGRIRKDEYVVGVLKFFPKGGREHATVHRLLYAALMKARSCETLQALSEELKDKSWYFIIN